MNIQVTERAKGLLADELWNGAFHAQRAHDCFLKAHSIQDYDQFTAEIYHRYAIEELDKLAEALGLELVARENVEGGR
jgi:hypothetical protein